MEVSVTEAKARLLELIRLAESGEEVVLTRIRRPIVRLVPVRHQPTAEERFAVVQAARKAGRQAARAAGRQA